MTTSELSNLCVLKSFIDNKRNMLDSLLPFVEYAIARIDSEWMKTVDIRAIIRDECLLDIPNSTLQTLLKTLKSKGMISDYGSWEHIQVTTENPQFASLDYREKLQSATRETNEFIVACMAYCKIEISEEEMTQFIYAFLTEYQHRIDMSSENGGMRAEDTNRIVFGKIAEFITDISHADNAKYSAFKNLFNGFLLSQFIKKEKTNEHKAVTNLTVYVDSSFLLRILDMQAPPLVEASLELLSLIREHKMTIVTLPESVDEVKNSITKNYIRYEKDKEYYDKLYATDVAKIDGIIGAFYRQKLQPSDILILIDDIENRIRKFDIRTIDIQLRPRDRGWSETEYNDIVRRKLKRANINPECEQLTKSQLREKARIERLAEFDESTLAYIRTLRIKRAYRFDQCRAILLTCDNAVYWANAHSHRGEATIAECVNETTFTNTLFMHNPRLNTDSSIKLLVSIFKSSSYLKYDILSDFHEKIAQHLEKQPKDKAYLAYMFQNQSVFDSLLEQQERDDNAAFVTQMFEEAKNACASEQKKEQSAQEENIRLNDMLSQLRKKVEQYENDGDTTSNTQKTVESTDYTEKIAELEGVIAELKEEKERDKEEAEVQRKKSVVKIIRIAFWGSLGMLFAVMLFAAIYNGAFMGYTGDKVWWWNTARLCAAPLLIVLFAIVVFKCEYLENGIKRVVYKDGDKSIIKLIVFAMIDVVSIILVNIFIPLFMD